jgi:hypothetical protein
MLDVLPSGGGHDQIDVVGVHQMIERFDHIAAFDEQVRSHFCGGGLRDEPAGRLCQRPFIITGHARGDDASDE